MTGIVLVTRPGDAGRTLCKLIELQGKKAIHFPTIAFLPQTQNSPSKLTALSKQNWLIFISPNAVKLFLANAIHIDPNSVQMAAVGPGTAKVLEEAGFEVLYPQGEEGSDALLALLPVKNVENKRMMIIRGEGGREVLAKTLKARGAIVSEWVIYKRVLPSLDCDFYQQLVKERQIHAIVCASFQGVHHLKIMLGTQVWRQLCSVPLIVVSKRIKLLVENLGFKNIWVAKDATHASIIKLLTEEDLTCQKN